MRTSTLLGLLVLAAVAAGIYLYAPRTSTHAPGPLAGQLCAHPVSVAGFMVSCDGTVPSPDPGR